MKKIVILTTLLLSHATYAEEMLAFLHAKIGNQAVVYEYPLSKVEKLPEWDMKGETPIPFKDAVKKAWAHIEREHPKAILFLEDVELDPRGYPVKAPPEKKKACWAYRFEFIDTRDGSELPKLVMLMDGTILVPTTVKLKANTTWDATRYSGSIPTGLRSPIRTGPK